MPTSPQSIIKSILRHIMTKELRKRILNQNHLCSYSIPDWKISLENLSLNGLVPLWLRKFSPIEQLNCRSQSQKKLDGQWATIKSISWWIFLYINWQSWALGYTMNWYHQALDIIEAFLGRQPKLLILLFEVFSQLKIM